MDNNNNNNNTDTTNVDDNDQLENTNNTNTEQENQEADKTKEQDKATDINFEDPRIQEYVKSLIEKEVLGLKTKNQELLGKLKQTNPDDYTKSQIEEMEKTYKAIIEKERKEKEEYTKKLNDYETERLQNKMSSIWTKTASSQEVKMKEVEIEDFKDRIFREFELNDKDQLVHKDKTKINQDGERYSVNDFIKDLETNRPHLFDKLKSGTGISSTKPKGDVVNNKMTLKEASELLATSPEEYERAKKEGRLPY